MNSPSNIPFAGTFDDGQYEVRAFNNEPSTIDLDQGLVFRALGAIRNEQKLLELQVVAVSGLNLINCLSGNPCPEKADGKATVCDETTNPTCIAADGREPEAGPLPSLTNPNDPSDPDFRPLTDPNNYYQPAQQPINFPSLTMRTYTGATQIDSSIIQNDSYYYVDGDATIKDIPSANNIVIFATGNITAASNVHLTNTILVSLNDVEFQGGGAASEIRAPLPYPVIIGGNDVTGGSSAYSVYGTVFAQNIIDANPVDFNGILIAPHVEIQGSSDYSDDHNVDPGYLKYYTLMPGFYYPPELKTTVGVPGGWREII